MAFNYWFYPLTGKTFEESYEDALVWEYFRAQQQVVMKVRAEQAENESDHTSESCVS